MMLIEDSDFMNDEMRGAFSKLWRAKWWKCNDAVLLLWERVIDYPFVNSRFLPKNVSK